MILSDLFERAPKAALTIHAQEGGYRLRVELGRRITTRFIEGDQLCHGAIAFQLWVAMFNLGLLTHNDVIPDEAREWRDRYLPQRRGNAAGH